MLVTVIRRLRDDILGKEIKTFPNTSSAVDYIYSKTGVSIPPFDTWVSGPKSINDEWYLMTLKYEMYKSW